MAGKEFVVDKAMCMCKYGAAPGKLMVTDNQFFRLNGTKLCASTMTLGNVIYPPGFGICKVNPMFPKPCVPAITQWNGQFSKITMMGGNPLTDKSKGTCSCGGPDCIEFMQTGQIPVPGSKQMQQATGEHQGELDAMGDPSALTKHPVDTPTSLLLKEGNILVKAVKGEAESFSGQTLIYEVEHYNTPIVSDEIRSHVKWKVTIGEKEETVDQPGTDVLELSVKEEWQGKKLCVQAYINQPSDNVKVNTQIKKWEFPIIVDRYKMPGLNDTGTDIADDMAYGYGVNTKKCVYSTLLIKQLIESYEQKHENKKIDNILSNSIDYDPEPPMFSTSSLDTKQKMERYIRVKNAKAIYSKEDFPKISSRIQEGVRFLRKGGNDFTDEELFADFEAMAKLAFSSLNSEMRGNIVRMIAKFRQNNGGVYEDSVLTDHIKKHPSTIRYCNQLETYIKKELQDSKGDVSTLEDIKIFFKGERDLLEDILKKRVNDKYHKKDFSLTPVYDAGFISFKNIGRKTEQIKNATQGYTIALNDIWSTEVIIKKYVLNGNSYTVDYRVTLWDHFGLDAPDLEANKVAAYGAGFRAWFILQHFRGYKPFITKITFDKTFKGKIQ